VVLVVLLAERAIEGRHEHAAVDGGLVDDDRVLLVEAREARDCDEGVDAARQVVAVHDARRVRRHQRLLGVVEHVRHGVEAVPKVGGVDADGLQQTGHDDPRQ
jgi:hypothetical protein